MIILLDNLDSFTYNIYDYLRQHYNDVRLFRSNEISVDEIKKLSPAGIVISPGPGKPKDHPLLFDVLSGFAENTPILGICLGQQAIGQYFGAELVKAPVPCHGKSCIVTHNGHKMYEGIEQNFEVGRYHSLVLNNIPEAFFDITAYADNNLPMSLAHKNLPLWAVQFHPESVLTPQGMVIFKNWLRLLQQT